MKPLNLVLGALVLLGLAAPAANAQLLTRERVQYALDMTDRRIEQAQMVLAGAPNDRAQAELDLAVGIQARAKSVFASGTVGYLDQAARLTLEARGHADRAIAIVRGLPHPDEHAREVLSRSQQLEDRALDEFRLEHYEASIRLSLAARAAAYRAIRTAGGGL